MKFFETSKYFSLKKSTYITLRWIGFFGQLLAIYTVHRLLEFEFNFLLANLAILVGILSNLFLIYIYKKTQLSERSAFIFLIIDILQLTFLLYLTGGVANPFIIFLIIPSIFSSFNLGFRINVFIVVITSISILLLTFFNNEPFNKLIENGHIYLAQPPLFKINKGTKGIYIKDEKELEDYILNNNKEIKKIKKGTKEFTRALDLEKSKMNIQRFKGLGEMNPEELWSTTLDPETRNLLQVQYSKDLKKDQSLIHTLMGSDVALRKDFIVSNAINVQNLDI